MIHIHSLSLLTGRCLTACFIGLAAGFLLVERAEFLITQRATAQKVYYPENEEEVKWTAILMMVFGTAMLLSFHHPDLLLLRNWLFFCLLFLSAYVDHFIYLIPNEEIILSLFLWGLWAVCMGKTFRQILLEAILAILFVSGILLMTILLETRRKQLLLGRGDIKLLFVTSLILGVEKALYVLGLACICGLLIFMKKEKHKKNDAIPLGPSIVVSAFLLMIL